MLVYVHQEVVEGGEGPALGSVEVYVSAWESETTGPS